MATAKKSTKKAEAPVAAPEMVVDPTKPVVKAAAKKTTKPAKKVEAPVVAPEMVVDPTKPVVKAAAKKATTKKASSNAKTALSPAAAWPFPTGNKP